MLLVQSGHQNLFVSICWEIPQSVAEMKPVKKDLGNDKTLFLTNELSFPLKPLELL
jgi:hypothetical protein